MEVRHPSYETPAFTDLLREHDIAVVTADTAGKWPMFLEPTTDHLVYVRLHGAEELYASGYDDAGLDRWAGLVAGWRDTGRDVLVYFDNDVKVRAPVDAQALAARLGVTPHR
jgi:uncharacterized protein YecE (DUF72 family)